MCFRWTGCLIRRIDYIPFDELAKACSMPQDVSSFILCGSSSPPCMLWLGHQNRIAEETFPQLLSFYVRWLQDQCWTSLQHSGIAAACRARIHASEPQTLRLLNPPKATRASEYKGTIVWVAIASRLREVVEENADVDNAFYKHFPAGTLHLVESSDVTNMKFKLSPALSMSPPTSQTTAPTSSHIPMPGALLMSDEALPCVCVCIFFR